MSATGAIFTATGFNSCSSDLHTSYNQYTLSTGAIFTTRGFSGCRHVPHTIIIPYQLGPSSRREVLVDADLYTCTSYNHYTLSTGAIFTAEVLVDVDLYTCTSYNHYTLSTGAIFTAEVLVDADMVLIQSLYLINWGHLHGRGFSGCRHVPHTIIIPYQLGPSSRREVLVDADMVLIQSLYLIHWGHLHGSYIKGYLKCTFL